MEFVELTTEDVRPLRTRVLRPHFDEGELAEFDGDDDEQTKHYGLVDDSAEPVAVVTYLRQEAPDGIGGPAVRLRGMAVAEDRRREGLGRRLLDSSLSRLAVSQPDLEVVWCNARTSAQSFYEKHGFRTHGEVFDVPEIGPHVVMYREMPRALAGP